ncbi:MAG: (2Fe-2S)-binding protein [bacterium]|nr:(2Fe-2S)-binding protein [bacterium]
MKQPIQLTVNGQVQEVLVEPRKTLLAVLRDQLQLTGTKEGCSTGDCGACTVLLDGKPVTSCLVLAVQAQGREVATVEGVANGTLHPIQKAMIDLLGFQCGFCTPGFIMSSVALLNRNPNPKEDEIRAALAGNLCRCTGYTKIVEAVKKAAREVRQQKGRKARKKQTRAA